MMNHESFETMKNIDICTVNPNDLVDIRDVIINTDKSKDERIADFIKQIKNPYCYKVGKIVVKVSFADNGITLEDRLENLIKKM